MNWLAEVSNLVLGPAEEQEPAKDAAGTAKIEVFAKAGGGTSRSASWCFIHFEAFHGQRTAPRTRA